MMASTSFQPPTHLKESPPLSCDSYQRGGGGHFVVPFHIFQQEQDTSTADIMPPRATLNVTLPVIPLIVSALVHFSFACLALMWGLPSGYLLVHVALLLIGIWASHDKEPLLPVFVYIFCLLFSGLIDMISLGVYWDDPGSVGSYSDIARFSAAMAIINLVLKPASLLFTVLVIYQRSSGFNFRQYFSSENYNELGGSVHVENGYEPPRPENN